jgi:hypothetical protein
MLAFITIIVSLYTCTRLLEIADAPKGTLRAAAIGALLLTLGSCTVAVLTTSQAP